MPLKTFLFYNCSSSGVNTLGRQRWAWQVLSTDTQLGKYISSIYVIISKEQQCASILPDFFVPPFFSLLGPFFERAPRFSQRHVPVLSRWVFVWMTCSLEQSGSSTLPTGVCGMLFRTIGINNINNGQCDRDGSKTRRWPRE